MVVDNSSDNAICPVCGDEMSIDAMFLHVFYSHAEFLAVWSSLVNPQLTHNTINNYP